MRKKKNFTVSKKNLTVTSWFCMQVRDKDLLFDRQTNQQTDNQPHKTLITVGVEEGGPEALHGHLWSDHRLLLPADRSSVVRVQVLQEKKVKKSVTIFVIY